jgi:hypothetical protein
MIGSPAISGHAQDALRLQLSEPGLANFPQVTLYAQVLDGAGVRQSGLGLEDFSLEEDGNPILSFGLGEETIGAQLVFAINTDLGLRIRDTLGRSRFDLAKAALLDWWSRPEFGRLEIDDLTLLTSDLVLAQHSDSAAELASSLDTTQPTFAQVDAGYELLFRSLDYLSAGETNSARPTSLIFVTTLLRQPRDIPLTNIITRARSTGTAIYPILMGEITDSDQPELEILLRLAEETGGQLTRFDEAVGLDPLAEIILSQRQQYRLDYRSAAAESGPHEVRLLVGEEGTSAITSYVLQIEPAQVTLLNVPAQIERSTDDPGLPLEDLPPTTTNIEFGVSYPDGYVRPIVSSRLIVDGEVVAQGGTAPTNALEWDLRPILTSGQYTIQVAVTDSLGLEGFSPPTTITFQIQAPPRGLSAIQPALGSLLLALAVLLAGVFFAVFIITSRKPRAKELDQAEPIRPALLRRAALQREHPDEPVEAYLVPLNGSDEYIPLVGIDTILGRDPSHAAVPIEDASVERMHARLIRQADGEYLIRDQGTTAGTWINYAEVPAAGQHLKHGDVVHLGAAGFRFELADAPPPRPIRVEPAQAKPQPGLPHGDQSS